MKRNQPLTTNFNRPMRLSLIVGAVAAVISIVGIIISGPGLFFQAYLFSFLFYLGISLGLLSLLLLHYSVSARWGVTIRRIAEAGGSSLWIMAVLFIPIIVGLGFLFPWARPAAVAASESLKYQTWYLNVPFFIIRAVIYFAAWIALAYFANRRSVRQANTPAGDQLLRGSAAGLGAGGMILIAFTMTAAAVDWSMSLTPGWISTAFGMVIVLSQVMTAMAFALLILNLFPGFSLGRRWNYLTTPIPFQDLGALTLTMVMAYAYVAFFQMLIQWAGNIPREVIWYVDRLNGGWNIVAIFVAFFQFVLPFCLLLTIRIRHNLRFLAIIGGMLLFTNLVNNFWHVKPAFYPGQFAISWLDIVVPIAMGGLWLAGFFYFLQRRPALSPTDQAVAGLAAPNRERVVHE